MPRVLFILKYRNGYGYTYGSGHQSSGLFNSARFVVEMLNRHGVHAELVQVVDNNDIDREVHNRRPDIVIIEGLWVVPEKFEVLRRLHPRVKWVVRIHSELPFLAMEGVAMEWIARYLRSPDKVYVGCNSARNYRDIRHYAEGLKRPPDFVFYLPNYYPIGKATWRQFQTGFLRIGCFGAIRPLKNQLTQAAAAVEFARRLHRKVRFYMTGRTEQNGDQVLKNIRALFAATGNELVVREWCDHETFLGLLEVLDVGMAVSLSESFCIVAADMVSAGVPVVVSPEVKWASRMAKADPTDVESIVHHLGRVLTPGIGELITGLNRYGLAQHSKEAVRVWLEWLAKL